MNYHSEQGGLSQSNILTIYLPVSGIPNNPNASTSKYCLAWYSGWILPLAFNDEPLVPLVHSLLIHSLGTIPALK